MPRVLTALLVQTSRSPVLGAAHSIYYNDCQGLGHSFAYARSVMCMERGSRDTRSTREPTFEYTGASLNKDVALTRPRVCRVL